MKLLLNIVLQVYFFEFEGGGGGGANLLWGPPKFHFVNLLRIPKYVTKNVGAILDMHLWAISRPAAPGPIW